MIPRGRVQFKAETRRQRPGRGIVQCQIPNRPGTPHDHCRFSRRCRTRARRDRTASRGHGCPTFSRPTDLPVDPSPGRDGLRRHDRSGPRAARQSAELPVGHHAGCREGGAVHRRHDEVPPRALRRQSDRVGLHPRHPVADLLPLYSGRLCDEVRVLPHRAHGHHPEPDGGRDRRPGPRAAARAPHARSALQHRPDGNGRTAPQLRRHDESVADPGRRARPCCVAATGHPLDGRRAPGARTPGERAVHAEPRDLAALDHRGSARLAWCQSTGSTACRICWTPAGDFPSSGATGLRSST